VLGDQIPGTLSEWRSRVERYPADLSHPRILEELRCLAIKSVESADLLTARAALTRAQTIAQQQLGERDRRSIQLMLDEAMILLAEERSAEAIGTAGKAINAAQRLFPQEPLVIAETQRRAGLIYRCASHKPEAVDLLTRALSIWRSHFPLLSSEVWNGALELAAAATDPGAAEKILTEYSVDYGRILPRRSWRRAVLDWRLGSALLDQHRLNEAEGVLLASYQTLTDALEPEFPLCCSCAATIARLYRESGKTDAAETWREKSRLHRKN
jgi:tetratricopeptide (TPR) repeat protein